MKKKNNAPKREYVVEVFANGNILTYKGDSFIEAIEKIQPIYPVKTKVFITGKVDNKSMTVSRNSLFMRRLFANKLVRQLLAKQLTVVT